MQLISIVLLLLSATSGLMASPFAEPNPAYVELSRNKTSEGSLIYLGPPEGSNMVRKEVTKLEEREVCRGTPSTECDKDKGAPNSLCDQLVTELFGDPTISVSEKARQICYLSDSSNNAYCCVSWNKSIKGLTKNDLSNPALKISRQCTENGISGKRSNVQIKNVCTKVCLSKRGKKCN